MVALEIFIAMSATVADSKSLFYFGETTLSYLWKIIDIKFHEPFD